ncbi:hypothetical protein Mapa_012082 [Marchantia paleacea]|nr:hypothetical protein Mapa_012082 [Marchantia paleacea]
MTGCRLKQMAWMASLLIMITKFACSESPPNHIHSLASGKDGALDVNTTMEGLRSLLNNLKPLQHYSPGLELHTNGFFYSSIVSKGALWGTSWVQNLWMDYYSIMEYRTDSAKIRRAHPASFLRFNITYIIACSAEFVDSLITDSNMMWNTLWPTDVLVSRDGSHIVEMQEDCDLVAYTNPDRKRVWATSTGSLGLSNCTAVMENDGNFAVYNSTGIALWSTRPSSPADFVGNFRFTIRDDGLGVVVDMQDNRVLWVATKL